MIRALYGFYLGAVEAEITYGSGSKFSAVMATYYCRWLMALESEFTSIEDLV